MLIDWEKGQAFGDNDEPFDIPIEWRRGVRDKATREKISALRYDTDTHLLARIPMDSRGLIKAGVPPIVEERELEPMPQAQSAFSPQYIGVVPSRESNHVPNHIPFAARPAPSLTDLQRILREGGTR